MGGTLCAHTVTLGMLQPHLQGTSPPQVDLSALALCALVVPRHPSASLGQRDHLAAAETAFFCFYLTVKEVD